VVVEEQPTVFVPGAPPPPQQEFIPMAPGPNYYWVRGYWNWGGYQWGWVPGYWEYAPPGHIYVEPTYVIVNGRWEYRRGYWNDHEGRREYVAPTSTEHRARIGSRPGPSARWLRARGAPARAPSWLCPAAAAATHGPSGSDGHLDRAPRRRSSNPWAAQAPCWQEPATPPSSP
jgi:hypothetical protein